MMVGKQPRVSSNPVIIETGTPGTHRIYEAGIGRTVDFFHGITLIIDPLVNGIPVRGQEK
ncbi:MAG: hypothetical protein WC379_03645 [Methanoregula sp.]|jgi:hypothetical protein